MHKWKDKENIDLTLSNIKNLPSKFTSLNSLPTLTIIANDSSDFEQQRDSSLRKLSKYYFYIQLLL